MLTTPAELPTPSVDQALEGSGDEYDTGIGYDDEDDDTTVDPQIEQQLIDDYKKRIKEEEERQQQKVEDKGSFVDDIQDFGKKVENTLKEEFEFVEDEMGNISSAPLSTSLSVVFVAMLVSVVVASAWGMAVIHF